MALYGENLAIEKICTNSAVSYSASLCVTWN
jgi:hypothetical protein